MLLRILLGMLVGILALSALPAQGQEGTICPPGEDEVCAPSELWSPPVYLPVVSGGEPQSRQAEPAQFSRLWLPIIGATALANSVGFSCAYLAENPTVVPNLMRRWGVPEADVPPTVTCDSLYFNTPDPVPIPDGRQLDELVVTFSNNHPGWWCVAAVRIDVGATILFWRQSPPLPVPDTNGYECKDWRYGCFWIALGVPKGPNAKMVSVRFRGNNPTLAYARCFPGP